MTNAHFVTSHLNITHDTNRFMSQPSHIIAKDAALIATFYGDRGQLYSLLKRLQEGFAPFIEHAPNLWLHETKQISLRLFDPPVAPDTSIIQLTLSLPTEAQDGWAVMGWRLGQVLDQEAYFSNVWGYSLIYQARVAAESWPLVENQDDAALDYLFVGARRLHVMPTEPPARLAHSVVQGGELWLTRVPLQQDGLDADTIYVALAPSEAAERQLIQKILVGPNAMLLMPDLVAHKGYHQRRQYRQNDIKKRYQEASDTLFEETTFLLAQRKANKRHNLEQLTLKYEEFLSTVPRLEGLRISLERQLYNFELLQAQSRLGDLLTFHHSYLRTTRQELNLLVAKGKETLEVSKTTTDLVQARLDEAKETRRQQIQILLAIIGSAFAITQLLDRDLTSALYTYFTSIPTHPEQDIIFLALMQIAITLVIALAFGCFVWLWPRRAK